MIRVLIATPFWQERSGPEENLLCLLGTKAFATSVDPVVALPAESPYHQRLKQLGVTTMAYQADLLQRTSSVVQLARWTAQVAKAMVAFRLIIRRIDPHITHSNMETTLGLALASRHADVAHVHQFHTMSFGRTRLAGQALIKSVCALSDAQVAVSSYVAGLLPPQAPVTVIENPVADAVFGSAMEQTDAPARVVSIGRISPQKELELFVEIAARLNRDIEFQIIGPIEDKDRLYADGLLGLAGTRGLGKRLTLGVARPVIDALQGASVLLNPGGKEGFCRVVAEAMAAGVPVVARDSGATAELVEHGRTGLLFNTVDEGVDAVTRLLRSPTTRRSLAEAAIKEAVTRFSAEHSAGSLLKVYTQAMYGHRYRRAREGASQLTGRDET